MSNRCILILPFFGNFNNYFPLFLRSCGFNPSVDFLIFSDNESQFDYPENVSLVPMTLEEFKDKAAKKLRFVPCLPSPYKLCDYKPAYGLLFEEYIQGYEYWGHCDCDLVFGNIRELLFPVLDAGYDKIFAAGHLTLYKNTPDNNRRFMKPLGGVDVFREAFTTSNIYVFDENVQCELNPERKNVHQIFLADGARVFERDLSYNVSTVHGYISREFYSPKEQAFLHAKKEPFPTRFYLTSHGLFSIGIGLTGLPDLIHSYLYMHLQSRKMRMHPSACSAPVVEIGPDRFISTSVLPETKADLRPWDRGICNHYWLDVYLKKIRARLRL